MQGFFVSNQNVAIPVSIKAEDRKLEMRWNMLILEGI
jgi:hypothetical protein